MSTVFIGAVNISETAASAILMAGLKVKLLISLKIKAGQKKHSDFFDFHDFSRKYNIPLLKTNDINSNQCEKIIKKINPDFIFAIGWSQIIRKSILGLAKKGSIGFHPSLLPQMRGRAAIPWTIISRQRQSGGTLFYLNNQIDSGKIIKQTKFKISRDETSFSLYEKHKRNLHKMIVNSLNNNKIKNLKSYAQREMNASYCSQRIPEDGKINWSLASDKILILIRATTKPYPGAFSFWNGHKVILWECSLVKSKKYFGIPGQIQNVSNDGILIMCGDMNCIFVTNYEVVSKKYNRYSLKKADRFK